MKQKKKSRFLNFCLAFMPGAAEMYMGFMKMGFSIMSIFMGTIFLGVVFRLEEVLLIICALLWFYSFFHARNIATSDDSEFINLEDRYIWEEFGNFGGLNVKELAFSKYIAYVLIFAGVFILWGYVEDIVCMFIPENVWEQYYSIVKGIFDRIPRIAVSIALIVVGAKLIKGKKVAQVMDEVETEVAKEVAGMIEEAKNTEESPVMIEEKKED